MTDLPDCRPFTWMLIGLWWPASPTGPTDAVAFWSGHMDVKQRKADENPASTADRKRQAPLAVNNLGIPERHLNAPHRRRHHRPLR